MTFSPLPTNFEQALDEVKASRRTISGLFQEKKIAFQAGAASRDAEVAQWQKIIDEEAKDSALVIIERDQLSAQINRLLDAVKVIETDSEEVLDFDECTAMCVPMDSYHDLVDAAEATHEQSLAEYRNKVIEDCAKQCEAQNEYGFHRTCYESAEAIRAMKEQP